MSNSYLSTGAITVAILSLGVEGGLARLVLGTCALLMVGALLLGERRDRLVAARRRIAEDCNGKAG